MDEFVELLKEYGLELDFVGRKNEWVLKADCRFLNELEVQDNAFEGLLVVLEELTLRCVDYKKLCDRIGAAPKYKNIAPVVENHLHVGIEKEVGDDLHVSLSYTKLENAMKETITELLKTDPGSLGVGEKELSIRQMFGSSDAIQEKTQELLDVVQSLIQDETIKKELQKFASLTEERLNHLPDIPEWYIQYGKKNKVFEKIVDESSWIY